MRESEKGLGSKTRQDRNGESNDSPEIPDRVKTSDVPGLPSGASCRSDKGLTLTYSACEFTTSAHASAVNSQAEQTSLGSTVIMFNI